jgi:hypothetical protein
MKNIQKSMLKLEIFSFSILSLVIFFGTIIGLGGGDIDSVFGQTEGTNLGKKSGNNNDLTTIKVKMIKNNLDIAKHDRLKVIGYLNGEGQTKYLDLKDTDEEKLSSYASNPNFLTVNLQFNKSNDISSTMVDDEYFVCAYVFNDSNKPSIMNTIDPIPLYDCDEGNIGTSITTDTVTLFSTMKKYGESKAFYTANQNTADNITNNPKELKITIIVPISDAKNIDDMNVVAMIKGEDQIKTIDVQEELKSENNKDGKIRVSFTFERQTEVGLIQPGDLFFGCATSDEFPNQNSDCEKRMLKSLDNSNKLCARKDNLC